MRRGKKSTLQFEHEQIHLGTLLNCRSQDHVHGEVGSRRSGVRAHEGPMTPTIETFKPKCPTLMGVSSRERVGRGREVEMGR